jgi:uncharacterized damage-inducible protein DinB
MRDLIIEHIQARFASYADLTAAINDETLQRCLDVPKSKSLKEHLWCVVGARESYTAALKAGAWQGFACSLQTLSQNEICGALNESTTSWIEVIENIENWTDARHKLLADLMEHEAMHEGQIIRLMYGLEEELPASWKWA